MRNSDHSEQVGSKRDEDSGWILDILKVLLTAFADRLDEEYDRKRSQRWHQMFGLELEMEFHWQDWQNHRKNRCVGKQPEISFGHVEFEWVIQRWVLKQL